MATSNLIQYLETADAAGTTLGVSPSDRKKVETFLFKNPNAVGGASITLSAGQVVAADVAQMATDATGGLTAIRVVLADFNSAPVQKVVVGVVEKAVTVAPQQTSPVSVVVRGPALSVAVTGAVAVGDPLILDPSGAAGTGAVQLPYNSAAGTSVSEAFAFALSTAAGPGAGTVTAYILNKGI